MQKPPNIVILHTHDTGRHLGLYDRGPATPNLSRMAAEGVVFNNAFATAATCSPSRASLFTGMVPHSHGLIGLINCGVRLHQTSYEKYLAAVLAREGFGSYLFGHQHEAETAEELGYQHVQPEQRCSEATPYVEDFFKSRPEQPFLAVVAFRETHRAFTEGNACRGEVRIPHYLPDHPDIRTEINGLNWDVEAVDDAIGRIIDAIDDAGLRDNTLVMYTTDHGIAFPGAKALLFDVGIEVALVVRGPGGFQAGRRIDSLTSNIDIFPTLMALAGIDTPDWVEGKSLLPLVRGETDEINDAIFVEDTYHAGYDPMRGIRTQRYKYIRSFEPRPYYFAANLEDSCAKTVLAEQTDVFERPRPMEFLFDLLSDSRETTNLADDPAWADVLDELRARLDKWMNQTRDPLLAGFVAPSPNARIARDDAFFDTTDDKKLTAQEWLDARAES